MEILVVGASGATGRLLVEQLLKRGHLVKVIVRSSIAFIRWSRPRKPTEE